MCNTGSFQVRQSVHKLDWSGTLHFVISSKSNQLPIIIRTFTIFLQHLQLLNPRWGQRPQPSRLLLATGQSLIVSATGYWLLRGAFENWHIPIVIFSKFKILRTHPLLVSESEWREKKESFLGWSTYLGGLGFFSSKPSKPYWMLLATGQLLIVTATVYCTVIHIQSYWLLDSHS